MVTEQRHSDLELCLDFSNTVDWRNGTEGKIREDGLTDYAKLANWSVKHGLIKEEEAKRLSRLARESGKEKSALRRALELRETIYSIFSATAHGRKPESPDLKALAGYVSQGVVRSKLVRAGERFRWAFPEAGEAPDGILWPIASSAADLLTSERLGDVHECANEVEGCGWLFLDCTKNHSRRWCSATGCGNRDKVRRFYETHRRLTA